MLQKAIFEMSSRARSSILLFGATGDLARRMLLPSLAALHADSLIPNDLRIIGVARTKMNDASYRAFAKSALQQFMPNGRIDEHRTASFLACLSYQELDVHNLSDFRQLAESLSGQEDGLAIFLSIAPSLFEPTIARLASAGLAGNGVRIGLEKPLGTDLASSQILSETVASVFTEDRIFRVDHYLGKEAVQNLLALRFANVLFEPLWNAQYIEHVQITVAETVGLEGRAEFYEVAGALRDMVQSHLLQLLALVAMEPPARFDATAIRDEKVKVLRSLRPLAPGESVTGQYRAGAIEGVAVPGYDEELERGSVTETFVAIRAHIDNWRWKGVPFYLRTGKRMPQRKTEIVIQFRAVPHSIFNSQGASTTPNLLIIGIQPEENITLSLMAKIPGLDREGVRLREVPLDISMASIFNGITKRIAYERLFLDLINGNQTLFVRRDEVEAQWEWIDAIRQGWTDNNQRPRPYTAGSWGPSAAIALAERDGVTWHD